MEYVHVIITRQDGNADPVVIYDNSQVNIARFPIQVSQTGTGLVTFRIFSIENGRDTLRATQPINFDE